MQGKLPLQLLKDITRNFSTEQELGRGGFAVVYKGVLPFGNVVAVKRLHHAVVGIQDEQFEAEVNVLMKLKHKNIVDLLGYCDGRQEKGHTAAEMQEKLLCYEYLPKGSLDKIISGESGELHWHNRFRIIKGICSGLQYLHEEWGSTPIIHLDLKPSNILLADDLMPKIADFGLSRLFGEEQTNVCTMNVIGSIGYIAPEYYHTGEISVKSDIFSLGVLILEIVSGMENHPVRTDLSASQFIENIRKNWTEMSHVASRYPSLEAYALQQVKQCIKIGLNCVQTDPIKRPTTSQIIHILGEYTDQGAQSSSILSSGMLNGCTASSLVSCKSENATQMQVYQARQVVERADCDLWEKALDPGNEHRRQLIDQVVTSILPESKSPQQVSAAVKAFMAADLPHELIQLLENIVLRNTPFRGNFNLQNLFILTMIKMDRSRVMDYVDKLDNIDGAAIGEVAVEAELFEEAFAVFRKFRLNVQAIKVLLDNIKSVERAVEFARQADDKSVWSEFAKERCS